MEKTIQIEGMMCAHCVAHVQKALEGVAGVSAVAVSLEQGNAKVTLQSPVADEALKQAVEDAGYTVTGIQ